MLKGVIFDMDGVLVNTEPMHYKAYTMLLDEYGYELPYEMYKPTIGSTLERLLEISEEHGVLPPLPRAEIRVRIGKNKEILTGRDGYEVVEGIPGLLKSLRAGGKKLAIASSSPLLYIRKVMEVTGLIGYFDEIVSGESVAHPKPAPDVFLKAAGVIGLAPDQCLVVEDSHNGAMAAAAAGMACIGFENPDSGDQDLSGTQVIVQGFEEVDCGFVENVYCRYHGLPVTVAETERLLLREMTVADVNVLYPIYQEPGVRRYLDGIRDTIEAEQEDAEAYIHHMYPFFGYGYWTVLEKTTGNIIGRAGITYTILEEEGFIELGYLIGTAYQSRGYALEACCAILQFVEEKLDVPAVHAFTDCENEASVHILQRLGFEYQGSKFVEGREREHYRLSCGKQE